jgi:hypothetical protein
LFIAVYGDVGMSSIPVRVAHITQDMRRVNSARLIYSCRNVVRREILRAIRIYSPDAS